mgnify:CR=1 FL=1
MTPKFDKTVEQIIQNLTEQNIGVSYGNKGGHHEGLEIAKRQIILSEGLIKTYPIDYVVSRIRKIPGFKFIDILYDEPRITHTIRISISKDEYEKFKKEFDDILNVTGYDISSFGYYGMIIEPKFPVSTNYQEWSNDFYHVTLADNVEKIQKIGLIPKSSTRPNFGYTQNRTYLFWTKTPKIHLHIIGRELYNDRLQIYPNAKSEYTGLKVDIEGLKNFEIFYDPQFTKDSLDDNTVGVFVLDNIHPKYITRFNVNEN